MKNLMLVLILILFSELLFSQTPNPPNIISNQPNILLFLFQTSSSGSVIAIGLPFYIKNIGGDGEINVCITAWNDTNSIYTDNETFTVHSNTSYVLRPYVPVNEITSSIPGKDLFISASFSGSPGITMTNKIGSAHESIDPSSTYRSWIATGNPIDTLVLVTGVKPNQTQIPIHFALEQNYPNPFNPSTSFQFMIPSKSYITLKVFDIIGREIATIASEELVAGTYTRQWNATTMPSGVYFYRLQAGTFTETKKFVLLR